jgi:excisionase family DNA binding protein
VTEQQEPDPAPEALRAYTAEQIAALLQVSPKTVHRLMNTKQLRYFRPAGRTKRVWARDLEAYLDRATRQSA